MIALSRESLLSLWSVVVIRGLGSVAFTPQLPYNTTLTDKYSLLVLRYVMLMPQNPQPLSFKLILEGLVEGCLLNL